MTFPLGLLGVDIELRSGDARNGIYLVDHAPVVVLDGVPFRLSDPTAYIGACFDEIVASFAEHGRLDDALLTLAREERDRAVHDPFIDASAIAPTALDFTDGETQGSPARFDPDASSPLAPLLEAIRAEPLEAVLAKWVGDLPRGDERTIAELGPGAGLLARRLATHADTLVLADRSLRALLTAGDDLAAELCIMDADWFGFRDASLDVIIAQNVIDLLRAPFAFLEDVSRALRPGGHLILSTPDPWAWRGEREVLEQLLSECGLTLRRFEDDRLWLREHSPRELQVFRVQLVCAERT